MYKSLVTIEWAVMDHHVFHAVLTKAVTNESEAKPKNSWTPE